MQYCPTCLYIGCHKKIVNRFLEMKNMGALLTIGLVLVALWLLGFISSNTLGGGIHLILVVAVILIILAMLG